MKCQSSSCVHCLPLGCFDKLSSFTSVGPQPLVRILYNANPCPLCSGRGGQWPSGPWFESCWRNFANSVYPHFASVFQSLVPSKFYLGVYVRGSKRSHTGGKQTVPLSWTPHSSLEKDNSLNHSCVSPNNMGCLEYITRKYYLLFHSLVGKSVSPSYSHQS